jgi:hypothetical protein
MQVAPWQGIAAASERRVWSDLTKRPAFNTSNQGRFFATPGENQGNRRLNSRINRRRGSWRNNLFAKENLSDLDPHLSIDGHLFSTLEVHFK